jgi:hypothetical protein
MFDLDLDEKSQKEQFLFLRVSSSGFWSGIETVKIDSQAHG